jgi:predicted nucleotidyltransferase
VEFKEKTFDNLAGLWVYLEEQFGRKVDIIYPHKNSNRVIVENIKKSAIYG